MQKKFNLFLFLLIIFFNIQVPLFANDKIELIGNKNISSSTILSLAPKDISLLDSDKINTFQKKLYETGFFEKVDINIKNNKIVITFIENPLVNFFFIEGVKNKETLQKIYDLSQIKENNIYQAHLVKNDVKNISIFLNKLGYLSNEINFKLIKTKNNQINIFYIIDLKNKFKINRIYFIGEKFFKSSTLKNAVYSSEHGWWKFFSNSTTPTEDLINFDINRLKNFYLNNGFYDAQVSSGSINILENNYADITYSINSGNQYTIDEIQILDSSKSLTKEILSNLNNINNNILKTIYKQNSVKKTSESISKYLSSSNFDLIINSQIEKITQNKLKLKFLISEIKTKKIIDKISIVGNNITDDFVIRNKLKLAEGDFFNSSKFNNSIDSIKDTGLFKNVSPKIAAADDDRIAIEINVEEQPTGEITAGAGAGSDGATITGGIREKNFLGKGLSLNSNVNIGTQKIFGNLTYSNPDFKNTGNTFKNSYFIENNDYENASYQNKVIGSNVSLYYEIYDKFFFNPGLAVDFDSVRPNSDASDLVKRREGNYFTSKIFYNASKNTKNREILPSEGYVFGVGQGLSLISDIPYINNRIFGSYYNEYASNFIGSIKYRFETINGFSDDIKFSDRLFVSGDNLRGFAARGIGPKLDNDFIGGNYSYFTTISSTVPNGLPEKWNATTNIFLDTANVWGVDDGSTGNSNKIRSSIGAGFSWISPLGPISITYAEPLSKANSDDVEQFNFKIGTAF